MTSDHETSTSLVCLSSPIISSRVLSQAHYCFLTYYSPYRNREIAPQKSLSPTVLNASAYCLALVHATLGQVGWVFACIEDMFAQSVV
jgi:hypothetical protein